MLGYKDVTITLKVCAKFILEDDEMRIHKVSTLLDFRFKRSVFVKI